MKIGSSYSLEKLQISDLVAAKRIGFEFVEFYIDRYWTDIKELELQLITIRDILDSYDLFAIFHLPHLNSQIIPDEDLWTSYVDQVTDQIEIIGKLGITKKLVFHGVFGQTEYPKNISIEKVDAIKDQAIREWFDVAKKHNITLMLENLDESLKLMKPVFDRHKELSFTFDIGHANLVFPESAHKNADDKIYSIFNAFEKRLEHIHIHDNIGGSEEKDDLHLPIGTGNIDFLKFFRKLKEIKYSKTITLEIHNPLYHAIYLEASYKTIQEIFNEILEKTKFG
ncbi:MAG: sugar phosphate isomerase/epimerase [Candidatus Heimdallarchaeota archaeon]|nr:sugar phosphate isomerase/epimerase [Candidatus Heimdallarchaeota archaeon]